MFFRTLVAALMMVTASALQAQQFSIPASPAQANCDSLQAENQVLREALEHAQNELIKERTKLIRLQKELDELKKGAPGAIQMPLPEPVEAPEPGLPPTLTHMIVDLPGRDVVNDVAVQPGNYESGVVSLILYVNRSGAVQSLKRDYLLSTTSSEKLFKAAETAARELRFSSDSRASSIAKAQVTIVFGE